MEWILFSYNSCSTSDGQFCWHSCELVGLYILYIPSTKYGKDLNGLYRDDGLACFKNICGPPADRIRKDFINIFR